jgi:general secretion pathway protein C
MITIVPIPDFVSHHAMKDRINALLTHLAPRLLSVSNNVKMQKFAPIVITWTMIAALCWMFAHWTWVFITPPPHPVLETPASNSTNLAIEPLVNAHLFGASNTPSSAVNAPMQISALGLKLRGVFAGEGKQGIAAIINIAQKDKAFKLGDEVAPGVTLTHVYADYVELSRAGVKERLNLDRTTQTTGLITPALNTAAAPNPLTEQQTRYLHGVHP